MTKHKYAFIMGVGMPTIATLLAISLLYLDGGISKREVKILIAIWAVIVLIFYGAMLVAVMAGKPENINNKEHEMTEYIMTPEIFEKWIKTLAVKMQAGDTIVFVKSMEDIDADQYQPVSIPIQ